MKRTLISILVLVAVFAMGFFSVDNTEAKPVCVYKKVAVFCCYGGGYVLAYYCCILEDGT